MLPEMQEKCSIKENRAAREVGDATEDLGSLKHDPSFYKFFALFFQYGSVRWKKVEHGHDFIEFKPCHIFAFRTAFGDSLKRLSNRQKEVLIMISPRHGNQMVKILKFDFQPGFFLGFSEGCDERVFALFATTTRKFPVVRGWFGPLYDESNFVVWPNNQDNGRVV